MKNRNYQLLLTIVLLSGLIIRAIFALEKPIWLDEQFTIFFASQFSIKELLINFSQDVHPGGYYLLIKILLNLTTNLLTLRFISSVIPQILAIIIILKTISDKKTKLFLATVLAINPFLINLSWELRSYSLVFLVASIEYLLLKKAELNLNRRNIFLLILVGMIGNSLHYLMYIFNTFLVLYLLKISKINKLTTKLKILFFSLILLAVQFVVANPPANKAQYIQTFGDASWIEKPNFNNIPKIYLMELGLKETTELYSIKIEKTLVTVSSYLILTLFVYWLITNLKDNQQKYTKFLYLVIYPHLVILGASIILPFLSNRFFLYQFTPNISIFIPRIHLPFTIFLWIVISELIITKLPEIKVKTQLLIDLTIGLFFITWMLILNNYLVNSMPIGNQQSYIKSLRKIIKENEVNNLYIWPEWFIMETINPAEIENISKIKAIKAEVINIKNKLKNEPNLSCDYLKKLNVFIYEPYLTLNKKQDFTIKVIDNCCKKQKFDEVFSTLNCNY